MSSATNFSYEDLLAANAALHADLAAVEQEAKTLRHQMDQKIGDFLAERVCCNGQDCGCMGITRYEQECGERLAEALRELAAARRDSQRLDKLAHAAPIALWRGAKADGTPMFEIHQTNLDGLAVSDGFDIVIIGSGTDIRAAIDAMEVK
jgi:hypothetical protein